MSDSVAEYQDVSPIELLRIFRAHGVEFDEKYVLD